MVDDGSDDSQAVPERGGAAVTNIRKLYERREANAVWGSTEHHQLRRARIEAARVEPVLVVVVAAVMSSCSARWPGSRCTLPASPVDGSACPRTSR